MYSVPTIRYSHKFTRTASAARVVRFYHFRLFGEFNPRLEVRYLLCEFALVHDDKTLAVDRDDVLFRVCHGNVFVGERVQHLRGTVIDAHRFYLTVTDREHVVLVDHRGALETRIDAAYLLNLPLFRVIFENALGTRN